MQRLQVQFGDESCAAIDVEHTEPIRFDDPSHKTVAPAAAVAASRLERRRLIDRRKATLSTATPLEQSHFSSAVTQALRHLHNARRLRTSLLVNCALVRAAVYDGDDAVMAIRRMLLESIDRLSREVGTANQGNLLRRRYVTAHYPQALLADALHMGVSTLRRHLQSATALLAADLWSREQRLLRIHTR
jgi:hypothetical protein